MTSSRSPVRRAAGLALVAAVGAGLGWQAVLAGDGLAVALLLAVPLGAVLGGLARPFAELLVAVPAALAATVVTMLTGQQTVGPLAALARIALVLGLLALGALAVVAWRMRRREREQGWRLARALSQVEDTAVERALAAQRAELAAQIHDSLGHRLTLLSVRLGPLTLDEDLPAHARERVALARDEAAGAVAELGETVALLRDTGRVGRGVLEPARLIGEAQDAGMDLRPDRTLLTLAEHVPATALPSVGMVLQEGLTNAARHAPGTVVTTRTLVTADHVELTVTNPVPDQPDAGPSGGHGLTGLTERVRALGGTLTAGVQDGRFVLAATVPLTVAGTTGSGRAAEIREQERAARRTVRWVVPATAGLLALLVLLSLVVDHLERSAALPGLR